MALSRDPPGELFKLDHSKRTQPRYLVFDNIVCKQGSNTLTYDEKANVELGEVFRIVLDYQGRLSRELEE